jgi:hypothetical protein
MSTGQNKTNKENGTEQERGGGKRTGIPEFAEASQHGSVNCGSGSVVRGMRNADQWPLTWDMQLLSQRSYKSTQRHLATSLRTVTNPNIMNRVRNFFITKSVLFNFPS